MAAFSVNDVLMKFVTLRYPVGEVIFIRGVMTVTLVGAVALALGHVRQLRFALTWTIVLRSIFDALTVMFFVIALVHMKLAELSAVFLTAPLMLTALSAWFYREPVGWRRWLAVVGRLRRHAVHRQTDACGVRRLGPARAGSRAFDGRARPDHPAHRTRHSGHPHRAHGIDRA